MSIIFDESRVREVTPEEYEELMKPHTRGCKWCGLPFLRYNKQSYDKPCIDGFDKDNFLKQMHSKLDYCVHCHTVSRDLTESCAAAPEYVLIKYPELLKEYYKIAGETKDPLERKYKLAYFLLQHNISCGVSPYDIRMGLALYYQEHGNGVAAFKLMQEEIAEQEQDAQEVYAYYQNIKYENLYGICKASSLLSLADLYRRIGEFDKALSVTQFVKRALKIHRKLMGNETIRYAQQEVKLIHKAALNGQAERLIKPYIKPRKKRQRDHISLWLAETLTDICEKPRNALFVVRLLLFIPIIVVLWALMLIWSILALPIAAVLYAIAIARWSILRISYTKLKQPLFGVIYSKLTFENTDRY